MRTHIVDGAYNDMPVCDIDHIISRVDAMTPPARTLDTRAIRRRHSPAEQAAAYARLMAMVMAADRTGNA